MNKSDVPTLDGVVFHSCRELNLDTCKVSESDIFSSHDAHTDNCCEKFHIITIRNSSVTVLITKDVDHLIIWFCPRCGKKF
jgi:hypothetical protein